MGQVKIIIKYLISSSSSFITDISLFYIFEKIFNNIVLATILARTISSIFNYILNRNVVFKSTSNKYKSLIEYFMLVIIQMLVSAYAVDILYKIIKHSPTIIKIVVDSIIFIINYLIQKYIIFKN